MSESDVGGKRWASRALIPMLLESKGYKSAGELVSGSTDVFSLCRHDIMRQIEEVEKERSVASSFKLQQLLEEARHEIAGHEAWQEEVISGLPKEDDDAGLTGPLRLAFTETAEARKELLALVKTAYEKYFSKP
jgi:hypothetical protein